MNQKSIRTKVEFSYYECEKGNFQKINYLPIPGDLKTKCKSILSKHLTFGYVKVLYPILLFLVVFFIISAVIYGLIFKIYFMIPVLLVVAYLFLELLIIINHCCQKRIIRNTNKHLVSQTDGNLALEPHFIGSPCCCFGILTPKKLLGIHVIVYQNQTESQNETANSSINNSGSKLIQSTLSDIWKQRKKEDLSGSQLIKKINNF